MLKIIAVIELNIDPKNIKIPWKIIEVENENKV